MKDYFWEASQSIPALFPTPSTRDGFCVVRRWRMLCVVVQQELTIDTKLFWQEQSTYYKPFLAAVVVYTCADLLPSVWHTMVLCCTQYSKQTTHRFRPVISRGVTGIIVNFLCWKICRKSRAASYLWARQNFFTVWSWTAFPLAYTVVDVFFAEIRISTVIRQVLTATKIRRQLSSKGFASRTHH